MNCFIVVKHTSNTMSPQQAEFERCKQRVNNLIGDINSISNFLASKKKKLRKAYISLHQCCSHEFQRESDGDYHKPGFYYICYKCHFSTTNEPKCELNHVAKIV